MCWQCKQSHLLVFERTREIKYARALEYNSAFDINPQNKSNPDICLFLCNLFASTCSSAQALQHLPLWRDSSMSFWWLWSSELTGWTLGVVLCFEIFSVIFFFFLSKSSLIRFMARTGFTCKAWLTGGLCVCWGQSSYGRSWERAYSWFWQHFFLVRLEQVISYASPSLLLSSFQCFESW